MALGVWTHVAAVYDGGSTPDSLRLFVNGVRVDDASAAWGGPFARVRNGTDGTTFGYYRPSDPKGFFHGAMAGGPFGPFFTEQPLSDIDVANLHDLGRAEMGLGPP